MIWTPFLQLFCKSEKFFAAQNQNVKTRLFANTINSILLETPTPGVNHPGCPRSLLAFCVSSEWLGCHSLFTSTRTFGAKLWWLLAGFPPHQRQKESNGNKGTITNLGTVAKTVSIATTFSRSFSAAFLCSSLESSLVGCEGPLDWAVVPTAGP